MITKSKIYVQDMNFAIDNIRVAMIPSSTKLITDVYYGFRFDDGTMKILEDTRDGIFTELLTTLMA
jgi:hypothetical protein